MEQIQYVGEHLTPGIIGQLAITLGFVSALFSAISYFSSTFYSSDKRWLTMGKVGFGIHGFSIFTVIVVMFFIMINRYYEYQYVWAHVSDELPLKYIASAFWEGQEGSFLLWMFWNIVLAIILIFKSGKWEGPVLGTIATVQVLLNSMILGVYIGFGDDPYKLGSNPLLLLRETMDAPIFNNADYLTLIKGNGLNPLLQNYWMTIHPPTLFLGFSSTVVPFAFAVGALIKKDFQGWLAPVLPWALFSGGILGIGILMGGAWAYEALTFGGYWAWDPVENMSLVPWIILVAGIHTNLIAKATQQSLRSTFAFYLLTFILIVYSTFLTRSGVLGDTSVHAFTEMGLENQLLLFLLIVTLIPVGIMIWRWKQIPNPEKEEPTSSREFWMFIGTLVLFFSSILITASTSLPVYNKIRQLFDPTYIGEVITDPIPHYNKYQIWIAVFIAFLSGLAQFLRYKENSLASRWRKLSIDWGISLLISILLGGVILLWIDTYVWQYTVLLFASTFVVTSNFWYWIKILRWNIKLVGSVCSHIGFGLMVIGVLASGLNENIITSNSFLMEGVIEGDDASLRNNVLLFEDTPVNIRDFQITYKGDSLDLYTKTYFVDFVKIGENGDTSEQFTLAPNILYEKDFSKIAAYNPSTKRYLGYDIFSSITALPQVEMEAEFKKEKEANLNYRTQYLSFDKEITVYDTVTNETNGSETINAFKVFLKGIDRMPTHPEYTPEEGDIALGLEVGIYDTKAPDKIFYATPVIVIRGQLLYGYPVQINPLNTKIKLPEAILDFIFPDESQLPYREIKLKKGERYSINSNYTIAFEGFNRSPEHPNLQPKEGDIYVGGQLKVTNSDGVNFWTEPVFLIRDNQPYFLKTQIEKIGFHSRFIEIDPTTETATFSIAVSSPIEHIPVEIATDSLRYDYIVLEAKVFPGINLFWLGATLMMLGLLLAVIPKLKRKYALGS
ncbi:MAG: hypothetical protein RLZZ248_311 [Bacteroidota bacterium]|jgi:cytochrome c-type biogenesis protein CcmF